MDQHISLEHQALSSGTAIIFPENALAEKLLQAAAENRKLTVKLGFDPTAPDLHLGHAVVLRKLRQFQDFGHHVVIVIGDFTACIGDPTGKNKARPPLSREQVQENARTYIEQVGKVLDTERCSLVFNDSWFSAMDAAAMIRLLSRYTVAQVMQRSDFQKRFREGTPIAMHELVYPLLQGQDSVMTVADVEIGGTDQLFNCTVGRHLQEGQGMAPQAVICMPLLRGIDGAAKMSKSEGNTVGLTDAPEHMFGRIMSVPDELLDDYLLLASGFDAITCDDWRQQLTAGVNPMIVKKALAHNIVSMYHDEAAAARAQGYFELRFQQRRMEDQPYERIRLAGQPESMSLLDLCRQLVPGESRSSLRRLITGGGVSINGEKETSADKVISDWKSFLRIRIGRKLLYELTME